MMEIEISLLDGKKVRAPQGKSILEILTTQNPKLLKNVVACRIEGNLYDLSYIPEGNSEISLITADSEEGIEILRHSTSHVMAQAVTELFPGTKVAIGPAIETGFYYDFEKDEAFTPEDIAKIESKMSEIIKSNIPFAKNISKKEDALQHFRGKGENYKVEIINEIEDDTVSLYQQGSFIDLCRGPHIPATSSVKFFKLLSSAGAYWRGDEKNKMLQRIYGTVFPTKEALEKYLNFLEEAKKRDHRKLGKELDLFTISDDVGAGLVIYLPNGALLRHVLEDFEKREHLKRGYQLVIGPQILKLDMWKKSGHYDNYREMMYFTKIDEQEYGIKPMNCLAHMLVYKSKLRSYRDLPLRLFELGTVHRHERSGVLHGLMRVRGFTQDDAHILCMPEQLESEIVAILDFVDDVMKIFGFEYHLEISTRPGKSIGSDETWEKATSALKGALKAKNLSYEICEGEGAFYGPKIDIKLKDALGRSWQCATIQCDFTLPERFDLTYVASDGTYKRPAMLHRVILGAMERFMGVLIEHFAGAFPVWLSPTQVKIMTVTDAVDEYAVKIEQMLKTNEIRCQLDLRNEKISFKIREAQLAKVPYMLIIGKKEMEEGNVSLRLRGGATPGTMSIDDFIEKVKDNIKKKMINP
ncbi:MAG: threonine--tRNA ligase [Candidatus Schekmanbacteria bacterium]|nr:threonine--tRNA ligase [Candidatus Schekmanbacteria bacterium]